MSLEEQLNEEFLQILYDEPCVLVNPVLPDEETWCVYYPLCSSGGRICRFHHPCNNVCDDVCDYETLSNVSHDTVKQGKVKQRSVTNIVLTCPFYKNGHICRKKFIPNKKQVFLFFNCGRKVFCDDCYKHYQLQRKYDK